VDFGDDCLSITFTEELLASLLDKMAWVGARRLYWNYTQPAYWALSADRRPSMRQTFTNLGDPLTAACRLAHARGMDFYAIIKPYETGETYAAPATDAQGQRPIGLARLGGIARRVDPFVMARPDLRVRGRAGDIPAGLERMPVTRIQLRQRDMTPIRIRPENLEIWASDDNIGYRKLEIAFQVSESIEICNRDVIDVLGNLVTPRGAKVRALNLAGLNLLAPFVAVTTNLDDNSGTFRNTAIEMLRVFGPGDLPLPIAVASHKSVWNTPRDFRVGHLAYDHGHGDFNVCLDVTNRRAVCPHCLERGICDCSQNPIYSDSPICRDGVIAFAKGRNAYVGGSICEAYPEVQDYWLSWVGHCLQAGVDGIDWRVSNHSCWTDNPDIYGFNQPVLQEYERRYGVNPDIAPYDPTLLGEVRGDFYDQFLRRVKGRLDAAGKRMHIHLEVESFRPDAVQARRRTRPGNIAFHWQRWLREGLPHECTLMGVQWTPQQILTDPVGRQMLAAAAEAGVPVNLRHFMWTTRDGPTHAERLEYAFRDEAVAGYNLYETASFYDTRALGSDGALQYYPGMLEAIRDKVKELGIEA
jgi:hypothetical protein